MQPDPLPRAERRKWALSPEDHALLGRFVKYLTVHLKSWAIRKNWQEMRRVLAGRATCRAQLGPGIPPQFEMLWRLYGTQSLAAEANARVALQHWATFIGGDAGEDLTKRLREWKKTRVKKVRTTAPATGLTTADWHRLRHRVAQDNDPPAVVIQFMLRGALRIGDVLRIPRTILVVALRDLTKGYDRMPLTVKGGKTHAYPIAPFKRQINALLAFPGVWVTIHDLLHPGGYWSAHRVVAQRLKAYAKELSIEDVHLHRIRHTVITEMYDKKGLRVAQELAGHESPETTERYIRRSKGTDEVSAALTELLDDDDE